MKISFDSDLKASIKIGFAGTKGEELVLTAALAKFDRKAKKRVTQALEAANFKGTAGSQLIVHAPEKDTALLVVVGVGELSKLDNNGIEKASAIGVKSILTAGPKQVDILVDGMGKNSHILGAHAAMGAKLATYRFDKYRTQLKDAQKPKIEKINIDVPKSDELFASLSKIADGIALARDLMNEPPNVLTTTEFATRLKEMEKLGVEVTILDEKQMAEHKMFSYLGVAQGSVNPPRLVVMNYKGGGDEKPVALVGKGLCFDSGGISIKPSGGMEDMKGDMGGAAAVSGAMLAIAGRKAKANVIGLVGLAENMPDAGAQRPGDIVASMSGQTIEVLNTDAEGRLVLCDVMTYAQRTFEPQYLVDLATLTGAIVISLGAEYAGLFTNSDELAKNLSAAGEKSGEKVWRLPLAPAYDKLLDSNIADMKNVQRSGPGAGAGSITAAQFLQRFVEGETKWAHIDIAGTAWGSGNDDARCPSWGTGFGVRLIDEFIRANFEK